MIRKHAVILITYSIVALVMTYPLAANLNTAIPGLEGDATSFVWAMGWMKTAIEHGVNPFRSDFVFYPLGGATQLLWATSLIALVSVPFQFVFGLIGTHNLFYLAATVLTAYGTFRLAEQVLQNSKVQFPKSKLDSSYLPPFQTLLLVQFVTEQRRLALRVSPLACFTAGLVFAFAPLRLGYGLAFFNLFNTQLIPFYVLFLLRATRDQSLRDAIIAGILLGLNAYIDFQIAAFLILFSGLLSVYDVFIQLIASVNTQSLRERLIAPLKMTLVPILLAGLTSFVIALPMLAMVAYDFDAEGGNYIRVFPIKYSAERAYDVASYIVPNAWSALYANAPLKIAGVNAPAHPGDVSHRSPDRQAFVGYIVLGLAVWAMLKQGRRARFWWLTALVFMLLSWGPFLQFFKNNTNIPLPYLLLHEIPIINHIRIPMRYGIMVSFALAMLAAIAINELTRRFANPQSLGTNPIFRFAILLLPVFILVESANLPFPLQSLTMPRIYNDIARVPGDFTVLEIPSFNWRHAAATEVYQAMHGKRILRAYTNRLAPALAEYVGLRGTPIVVRSLRILEGAEQGFLTPEELAEDLRARDAIVNFFDLRYAIVHRRDLNVTQVKDIDAYLRNVLKAQLVSDADDVLAYEIPRATLSSTPVKIDLRENLAQMYAGRGWWFQDPPANFDARFNFVWARGTKSEVYFRADAVRDYAITLNAYADPDQRVVVVLNGVRVGEINLQLEWQNYRVSLPARVVNVGMNRIELLYDAELNETIGVTMMTIE